MWMLLKEKNIYIWLPKGSMFVVYLKFLWKVKEKWYFCMASNQGTLQRRRKHHLSLMMHVHHAGPRCPLETQERTAQMRCLQPGASHISGGSCPCPAILGHRLTVSSCQLLVPSALVSAFTPQATAWFKFDFPARLQLLTRKCPKSLSGVTMSLDVD